MTKIDLDELKRLAGLVTPGEWFTNRTEIQWKPKPDTGSVIVARVAGHELDSDTAANAAAIVTLRNALPELIAALEVVALVRDEDWLEERISDTLDMDWRPIDAARAIIAALPKETDNG